MWLPTTFKVAVAALARVPHAVRVGACALDANASTAPATKRATTRLRPRPYLRIEIQQTSNRSTRETDRTLGRSAQRPLRRGADGRRLGPARHRGRLRQGRAAPDPDLAGQA